MRKILAFTLAETLIVMGIIGIVSALTLPNLNSSTGEKEKVAKVKKIYRDLTDALGRAEAVYGPFDTWFINDSGSTAQSKRFGERMTEFMKLSKDCKQTVNSTCYSIGGVKKTSGTISADDPNKSTHSYKVILSDGIAVVFLMQNGNPTIFVDINGPNKGQQTWGEDNFWFTFNNNTLYPAGYNNTLSEMITNVLTGYGIYSTAWIINYDNMDYLKLDSSGKCPNGTTPTEQNPRCK